MSYRGTPAQIADEIRLIPVNLKRNLRDAEKKNIREAQDVAQKYSSGPYKSAQLAAMGHPYATRDPKPPMDPGIINRQSGLFVRSFRVKTGTWKAGELKTTLSNVAPYWIYLKEGTRKMIRRPIADLIIAKIRKSRVQRLAEALHRTLHP